MNLLNVSLAIHLYPLRFHLQSLSSKFSVLFPLNINYVSIWGKWAFFVTQRKNFPKQNDPRHFLRRRPNTKKRSKSYQTCCVRKPYSLVIKQSFHVLSRLLLYLWYEYITDIIACHQQWPANLFTPFCHIKQGPGGQLQATPARLQASLGRSHLSRQAIRRPSPIGDPYSFFRGSVPFHRHPTVSNGGRTSTGTVAWVLDLAL